jgi:hypothetical protein
MKISPRGVPEVPMLPDLHPQVRRFLVDLRQSVLNLRPSQAPLLAPTNLTVTPQDRSNLILFTRSANADYFEILWNSTPNLNGAQVLNITTSNQYHDWIGQVGVARYYWVRARYFSNSQIISPNVGPVSGTTLAVGTAVNFPNLPPPSQQQSRNLPHGYYGY